MEPLQLSTLIFSSAPKKTKKNLNKPKKKSPTKNSLLQKELECITSNHNKKVYISLVNSKNHDKVLYTKNKPR